MKRQIKSFVCAVKGILSALFSEGHMRFHLVAAFFVLLFAYIGNMTPAQWAILTLAIGAVFATELINTAFETLCDRITKESDPEIGKVKDIAAGAVLAVSAAAAGVAVCMFLFTGKLLEAVNRLIRHPWFFLPLGICIVISVLFILMGGNKKSKK